MTIISELKRLGVTDEDEIKKHYIENQLKGYLNRRFDIEPEIPLKKNEI